MPLLAAIILSQGMISPPACAEPRAFIRRAVHRYSGASNMGDRAGWRMSHRAVLAIADREVALTGVLTRSPEGEFRLALLAGFGIVLAEVRVPDGGAPAVVRNTPPFRAGWARRYAMRDALRLFAHDRMLARREESAPDGSRIVEGRMPDGARLRLTYPPGGKAPARIEALTRTGRAWIADCEAPRYFEALGRTLPTRFKVNAGAYRLDLTLLSAEPTGGATSE
ncbi:MAG: hypothetical protein GX608_00205 [Lentisphaerae bacterium]|nr:hypothetical protein [Lentisphaerota bacterium]